MPTDEGRIGKSRDEYWHEQYDFAVDVLCVIGHRSAGLISDQAKTYADYKTSQLFAVHVNQVKHERENGIQEP